MTERARKPPLTLLGLLVLAILAFGLFAVLLPVLLNAREHARRTACANSMKQLGLACHNYLDSQKKLPPSGQVTTVGGKIAAVDGWSWLVAILPYMDQPALWKTLDPAGKPFAPRAGAAPGGDPHAAALATVIPGYICPSFRGSSYADPGTKRQAITNYKGIGATHIESLSVASPAPRVPKYLPNDKHPDGVMFPGAGIGLSDISDGTSNTILAAETIEPKFARWTVGAEASLVGLPRNVEYSLVPEQNFFGPRGFVLDKIGEKSTVDPTFHTYLSWDFEQHPYDGADVSPGKYGPSSMHLGIVNHLFCDGGVRSTPADVDIAVYMFAITRRGGDYPEYYSPYSPLP